MALTLNSTPARIDRTAPFKITTSLVEDSTHVNMRVRAELYFEGVVKATIEKPVGLAAFEFSDILKSLVPGLLFARDSGDISKTGTIGSELLTSFASHSGTWTTLTTADNVITSAICTAVSELETNEITVAIGELYLFYSANFASTGDETPAVYLHTGGAKKEELVKNKGFLLMPTAAGAVKIIVGGDEKHNFSGTFHLYKITTSRTTIGNPLAPYFINFTEIYEIADGTTTAGASSASSLHRYVSAYGDGIAFTEYVMHDNACHFACKTFKYNIGAAKVYSNTPYEYWISFFSEYVELELFYSKDEAGYVHTTHPVCYEGWGVIILNVGEILATVVTQLTIFLQETSAPTVISEMIMAYIDSTQNDARVVLEYHGLVGGKDYLAFEGMKKIDFTTIRDFYSGIKKTKKPLSLTGINRQSLATRFKDMGNAEYLKSLLISEKVLKLEASYAAPTEVTIISDSVRISNSDMFDNQIEVEYDY
jgi:hypothetical protein